MQEPDYSATVRLPKTDFPMRGNLPKKEPSYLERWDKNKIYQRMVEKNSGQQNFSMPDGPPYANNNIHVGHVLNKVLKDIVIKYMNMSGRQAAFIPGWDCHGLPIEHKVTKDLGEKRRDKTDKEMRDFCRQEANHWVDTQREQFKRLGILADWDNPYKTLDARYEADEVRALAQIVDNGIVYQGVRPVYWCWALQTALADAEVEYHEHTSPSIYVKFDMVASPKLELPADTAIVIWTTTPWTLPANVAIAVHADFEYGLFASDRGHFIIARELKESVEAATELQLKEVQTFKGAELENLAAQHPFIDDRKSKIILGDHVTLETGTGCVHTAPGHGADDFRVGKNYDLPVLCPVDEAGKFTKDVPEYMGEHIFKANPKIVERLKNSGHLLAHKQITHSYPHCWRSKTPLIFRTTPQWFIALDDESFNVREKCRKSLEEVKFYPDWGKQRFQSMLENRPDWCISRQRLWGVPIPVFYCKATGQPLLESKYLLRVAEKMEESGGIEAWWDTPAEEFLEGFMPAGEFGSEGFRKGQDILDVWFDSGVCHTAVQEREPLLNEPADIYLEGSDQHRGWFNTSLISSIAGKGRAPFKSLVTHGFVLDQHGRKMSKSAGNVVDPAKVIAQSGAEILRLWSSYEDYGQDLSCGKEGLARVSETYRRLRNTMRFLLGNLEDFDYERDKVEYSKLDVIDKWALHRLNELVEKCTKSYEEFDFYKVYHALNLFFTVDMSSLYLDILKDRLYTWKPEGERRRGSQTVLYEILSTTMRLFAPILSFLAEEVYDHFPGKTKESIFLNEMPTANDLWHAPELAGRFDVVIQLRAKVSKVLEELRADKVIRSSLEAQVRASVSAEEFQALKPFAEELREILIVSKFELVEAKGADEECIECKKASGDKCPRCWHFSDNLQSSSQFPGVCPKCVEALS